MATDHLAIAQAIATKCGTIAGVRASTAEVPDAIPFTPYVVVFPPDQGKLTEYMSQDVWEEVFPVYLYLARPGDTGRTLDQVYPYIDAFYTVFRQGRYTTVANVQEAFLTGHVLDDLPDYEGRFLGIRFHVTVRSRENVSRTP